MLTQRHVVAVDNVTDAIPYPLSITVVLATETDKNDMCWGYQVEGYMWIFHFGSHFSSQCFHSIFSYRREAPS